MTRSRITPSQLAAFFLVSTLRASGPSMPSTISAMPSQPNISRQFALGRRHQRHQRQRGAGAGQQVHRERQRLGFHAPEIGRKPRERKPLACRRPPPVQASRTAAARRLGACPPAALAHSRPCPADSRGRPCDAIFAAALAAVLVAALAARPELPDLGGREVVVVTENAYPPLQFVDPGTGEAIGWEYDAMDEIAKRLNFTVEYENASWDAMIPAVAEGQYDIGMTGITIRDERSGEGRLLRSLHALGEVHAGARRRGPLHRRRRASPRIEDGLVGAQPAPRRSTSRSTRCSTATRRTRASSCSRPSAPACRRCRPATSTWC